MKVFIQREMIGLQRNTESIAVKTILNLRSSEYTKFWTSNPCQNRGFIIGTRPFVHQRTRLQSTSWQSALDLCPLSIKYRNNITSPPKTSHSPQFRHYRTTRSSKEDTPPRNHVTLYHWRSSIALKSGSNPNSCTPKHYTSAHIRKAYQISVPSQIAFVRAQPHRSGMRCRSRGKDPPQAIALTISCFALVIWYHTLGKGTLSWMDGRPSCEVAFGTSVCRH